MANAMVALANLTLGSAQATVTFSNIPTSGTYRDLRLVVNAGYTGSGSTNLKLQVNSDTGGNYSAVWMGGSGSSATSSSNSGATFAYAGVTSSTSLSPNFVDFLDYSATDKHKSMLCRGNTADQSGGQAVSAWAMRWASTSAITSIVIFNNDFSFPAGSTFSLYGIVS